MTNDAPHDDAPIAAPSPRVVICRRCGYDLRGLDEGGRCPECETAVALSMRDDLLRYADPDWLRALRRGMWLLVVGTIAAIVITGLGVAVGILTSIPGSPLGAGASEAAVMVLNVAMAVIIVAGAWLVTTPDPTRAGREERWSARRLTRWTLTTYLVAAPSQILVGHVAQPNSTVGPLLTGTILGALLVVSVVSTIGWAALLILLRDLLRRVPRPRLAHQCTIVMYGWVSSSVVSMIGGFAMIPIARAGGTTQGAQTGIFVLGAGVCGAALVFLVFEVWFIILLLRVRSILERVAVEARDSWSDGGTRAGRPV